MDTVESTICKTHSGDVSHWWEVLGPPPPPLSLPRSGDLPDIEGRRSHLCTKDRETRPVDHLLVRTEKVLSLTREGVGEGSVADGVVNKCNYRGEEDR